jgi:MFS family permease
MFRTAMLTALCLVTASFYYAHDAPALVATNELDYSRLELALLYGSYALPNAVGPLAAVYAWRKVGVFATACHMATVSTLGVCVSAVGVATGSLVVVCLGRALMGLGGDALYLTNDVLIANWFGGPEERGFLRLGGAYGLLQAAGQVRAAECSQG